MWQRNLLIFDKNRHGHKNIIILENENTSKENENVLSSILNLFHTILKCF